jgi:uncharacterized protein (TIGR02646 family)
MRCVIFRVPTSCHNNWIKAYIANKRILRSLATHGQRAEHIRRHAIWSVLKRCLASAGNEKCWYCEVDSRRSPCDVDHFRPKLGITVDDTQLAGHLGYYWLAYEWRNFRFSCIRCNRPEKDEGGVLRGKDNEFPLFDEASRCTNSSGSLASERPRLLDPCHDADCNLLAHPINGEVKPSAEEGTWEYFRAEYTIRRLGFNCHRVPKYKQKIWQTLNILLNISGDNPSDDVRDTVRGYLNGDQEYLSFFRASVGTHHNKEWIKKLL